jgi:hypothetical protein
MDRDGPWYCMYATIKMLSPPGTASHALGGVFLWTLDEKKVEFSAPCRLLLAPNYVGNPGEGLSGAEPWRAHRLP